MRYKMIIIPENMERNEMLRFAPLVNYPGLFESLGDVGSW